MIKCALFLSIMLLAGPDALATVPAAGFHTTGISSEAQQRAIPGSSFKAGIGDTLTFNVRRFLFVGWMQKQFRLVSESSEYALWVALSELGRVKQTDIEQLVRHITSETPSNSVNPTAGIFSNNEAIFGEVNDYDGNSKVTILWFDIPDDYTEVNGVPENYTASYVDPLDIDPAAPAGSGNQADVIYVDTNPLLLHPNLGLDEVASTIAFEHARLIQFRSDPGEHPLTLLGLAHLASMINGYPSIPINYLDWQTLSLPQHGRALFSWEGDLADEERGKLFHAWLYQRFGASFIRALTQNPLHTQAGYEAAFAELGLSTTFADALVDFHSVNGTVSDKRFSEFLYDNAFLQDLSFRPTRLVEGSWRESDSFTTEIQPGGAHYLEFENVRDLTYRFDRANGQSDHIRSFLKARLFFFNFDGTVNFQDVLPGTGAQLFPGTFERVMVLQTHVDTESPSAAIFSQASWTGTVYPRQFVQYDDGIVRQDAFFATEPQGAGRIVSQFRVPDGANLHRVYVAPHYLNQFLGSNGQLLRPVRDPRNFQLVLYDKSPGGLPGNELFSLDVDDLRPFDFPVAAPLFLAVDMSPHAATIGQLPQDLFIGIADSGNDLNYTVAGVSNYATENTSYVFSSGFWQPLWSILLAGGTIPLSGTTALIRASFSLPGGPVQNENSLPEEGFLLASNFPNPFQNTTTIGLHLDTPGEVVVEVFDLLGRRKYYQKSFESRSGEIQFPIATQSWPSGMYVYAVTAKGKSVTGSMIRLK